MIQLNLEQQRQISLLSESFGRGEIDFVTYHELLISITSLSCLLNYTSSTT